MKVLLTANTNGSVMCPIIASILVYVPVRIRCSFLRYQASPMRTSAARTYITNQYISSQTTKNEVGNQEILAPTTANKVKSIVLPARLLLLLFSMCSPAPADTELAKKLARTSCRDLLLSITLNPASKMALRMWLPATVIPQKAGNRCNSRDLRNMSMN